jgi:hypothetical protein
VRPSSHEVKLLCAPSFHQHPNLGVPRFSISLPHFTHTQRPAPYRILAACLACRSHPEHLGRHLLSNRRTMHSHATTLLLVVTTTQLLLLAVASPALPDPAILEPSLLYPSAGGASPSHAAAAAGSASSSTIPAFPEQSEAALATSVCQLAPSPPLLPGVLASCNAGGTALPPRLRCCPALTAWLYAAYAPAALSSGHRPGGSAGQWRSEAVAAEGSGAVAAAVVDLPALPDDSEECAGAADRALRAAGATLPQVPSATTNRTAACDVAFCYCGVKLRRPACALPEGRMARRLQRECGRPGLAGCSGCLRALDKVPIASSFLFLDAFLHYCFISSLPGCFSSCDSGSTLYCAL